MNIVTKRGTLWALIAYLITGIFGYFIFAGSPEVLKTKNILDAPFSDSVVIIIASFTQFLSILTSYPLVLLPCKDTIEELFWKHTSISFVQGDESPDLKREHRGPHRMSAKANFFVTFLCALAPYTLAFFLTSLGDALTVVGSTTNPVIGFIIPIMFYWKVYPDKPLWSKEKLPSLIIVILVILTSIIDLLNFFLRE